jgi:hypothetical protein
MCVYTHAHTHTHTHTYTHTQRQMQLELGKERQWRERQIAEHWNRHWYCWFHPRLVLVQLVGRGMDGAIKTPNMEATNFHDGPGFLSATDQAYHNPRFQKGGQCRSPSFDVSSLEMPCFQEFFLLRFKCCHKISSSQ